MKPSEVQVKKDFPAYFNSKGLTGIGVEVGVLKGEYSKIILDTWLGKKLYLVDVWRHMDSNVDINNGNQSIQLQNMGEAVNTIYKYGSRAVIIRETSYEASTLFHDHSLDFVYIDAAHDYVNVIKDLEAWYPKVKPGGILCGDDYLDGMLLWGGAATAFEVERAVNDFAKERNLIVNPVRFENQYPQWFIEL